MQFQKMAFLNFINLFIPYQIQTFHILTVLFLFKNLIKAIKKSLKL
jgi:hypothetical protein